MQMVAAFAQLLVLFEYPSKFMCLALSCDIYILGVHTYVLVNAMF